MSKLYKWLYTRIGGRPWTFIIRDNAHANILWWLLGFGAIGIFLGHLFW